MGISRRKFLKGLLAAPVGLSVGSFFTKESLSSMDKAFNKLAFDPTQTFRHAVAAHSYKVRKLEGAGISGDDILDGNEEMLNYEMLSEAEATEEGKKILWDYINWKIPKRYHKFITFHSDWDDLYNEFGIAFMYHPIKCGCISPRCPR